MRLELESIDDAAQRASYWWLSSVPPKTWRADFSVVARHLSSGLLSGLHGVTVNWVMSVDAATVTAAAKRGIDSGVRIRVPAAAWAAVVAEPDAVAAALTEGKVWRALVVIESDAPRSNPDHVHGSTQPEPGETGLELVDRVAREVLARLIGLPVPCESVSDGVLEIALAEIDDRIVVGLPDALDARHIALAHNDVARAVRLELQRHPEWDRRSYVRRDLERASRVQVLSVSELRRLKEQNPEQAIRRVLEDMVGLRLLRWRSPPADLHAIDVRIVDHPDRHDAVIIGLSDELEEHTMIEIGARISSVFPGHGVVVMSISEGRRRGLWGRV